MNGSVVLFALLALVFGMVTTGQIVAGNSAAATLELLIAGGMAFMAAFNYRDVRP